MTSLFVAHACLLCTQSEAHPRRGAQETPTAANATTTSTPSSSSGISNNNASNSGNNEWLSNVEICTHSPLLRPLWANPQFTFKTFQLPNSASATTSPNNAPSDANI